MTLAVLSLGIVLGLANFLPSALGAKILKILCDIEFVSSSYRERRENRPLHIWAAMVWACFLSGPGIVVHWTEALVASRFLPAELGRNLIMVAALTFSVVLFLIYLKISGLLRRVLPDVADGIDAVKEWIKSRWYGLL